MNYFHDLPSFHNAKIRKTHVHVTLSTPETMLFDVFLHTREGVNLLLCPVSKKRHNAGRVAPADARVLVARSPPRDSLQQKVLVEGLDILRLVVRNVCIRGGGKAGWAFERRIGHSFSSHA